MLLSLLYFLFLIGFLLGRRTWSERDGRFLASLHLVDSERVLSETRTTVFNRPPTREEFPSPDLCQIQIQRRFSFVRSLQVQIHRGFFSQERKGNHSGGECPDSFIGSTKCSTVNHLVNCVTIYVCQKKFNLAQHYEKWTSIALQGNEVKHWLVV